MRCKVPKHLGEVALEEPRQGEGRNLFQIFRLGTLEETDQRHFGESAKSARRGREQCRPMWQTEQCEKLPSGMILRVYIQLYQAGGFTCLFFHGTHDTTANTNTERNSHPGVPVTCRNSSRDFARAARGTLLGRTFLT